MVTTRGPTTDTADPARAAPTSRGGLAAAARVTFVRTVVVVAVVAGALALWKLKLVIALLFLAMIVAAAIRPGVEALARRRVPRVAGILLHYLALLGLIALFLAFLVPQALDQVQAALAHVPTSRADIARAAAHSGGIKRQFLLGLEHRLRHLPAASSLIHPALSITKAALEVLVGIL